MQRIWSTQLAKHAGSEVKLAGWLHRHRQLKDIDFLILRDAQGLAQIIVTDPQLRESISDISEECVITVEGAVAENTRAPGGAEIVNPRIEVLSRPEGLLPFELWRPTIDAGLPVQLDNAALALRHPHHKAVARMAAASVAGFRSALLEEGFTEVQTPKIVASSTESGANVFGIDYFGRKAFLAQSPQFYKQTLVGVFERVFEVAPVFRAEPHDTARHLAEYISMDAEFGFIEDHTTVMAMLTKTIQSMIQSVAELNPDPSLLADGVLPRIPSEIPAVHFSTALEMISADTGEDVTAEPDLAPAHERWLGEWALREHGSDFLYVTGYPARKRPFYTHPEPGRPEYTNSFDLLFRGLELVTGGQRLHHYRDYLTAISERGEDPATYQTYLDAFRYGMPPHGGFAIGLQRWTARLTGAGNVRSVTLFPRDIHRLTP